MTTASPLRTGRLVLAGVVGLTALLGGMGFQRVFGWEPALLRLAAAAVIPIALAGWTQRRADLQVPLPLTGSLSLVAMCVYLVVATGGPTVAASGLVSGWARILTTTLPVPANAELLALPIALTWLCSFAGAELAIRARAPQAGFLPSTLLLASALFLGSRRTDSSAVLAGFFVFTVLAGFLVDQQSTSALRLFPKVSQMRFTQAAMAGLGLAGSCAVAAVLLGPSLPLAQTNPPLRAGLKAVSAESLESITPVALLAGWALDPQQPLFRVESGKPARWRLAVFDVDDYDPQTGWSSSPGLEFFGGTLLEPAGRKIVSAPLDYRLTIDELPGIWVPAADRPASSDAGGLMVDPVTGVLLQPGGVQSGQVFSLSSNIPATAPDCSDLVITGVPSGRLPDQIIELGLRLRANAQSPCELVASIEDYLRAQHFKFSREAPSGADGKRILDFLGDQADAGLGTSEQFATAFALIADAAGIPARLAVGFHAGNQVGSTWHVRAGDAFAYVELQTSQGWRFYDPTPAAEGAPEPPERDPEDAGDAEAPVDPPRPGEDDDSEAAARAQSASPYRGFGEVAIFVLKAAVFLLILLAGSVWLTRRRLRRARDGGKPGRRVAGAWHQAIDELRGNGVVIAPSSTVEDCITTCSKSMGTEATELLEPLGMLANISLFSEDAPPLSAAQEAWILANRFGRILRGRRTLPMKVRYALDPWVPVRALLGRRGLKAMPWNRTRFRSPRT